MNLKPVSSPQTSLAVATRKTCLAVSTRKTCLAVSTRQTSIHDRLSEVLARHQNHPDQTPIAPHSTAIWPQVQAFSAAHPSLVLDLGCGTGESSQNLAHRYPKSGVLGLDRSSVRLRKAPNDLARNYLHLRGDQYDLLRLMKAHGLRAEKVYLLYPNPSPKPEHLKRRWHAHPIWPTLLKVTDVIELRTNWSIYAEEFAFALQASGWHALIEHIEIDANVAALSLFEAKYARSGHALWRVVARGAEMATVDKTLLSHP